MCDCNFPSLVASLFSWRCLAASSSSSLHAAMNLRPPFVTASTQTSAFTAIVSQSPVMPNARMSLCTLPLPLSSCLGCIPPLIGLPSLRFYAVGSSLFLLSVCFCLCSLFYRDDVLCWLLLARPFLYAFHAHLRFPVDLVWFRLSCDHGWIRSGSVNVRKQQQQQHSRSILSPSHPVLYALRPQGFRT